jgi:hypothetical protein
MTSSVEAPPTAGPFTDRALEALRRSAVSEDRVSVGREINERRARYENPEALRLARAL